MIELLKDAFKQPYWVLTLILGVALIVLSCVTLGKGGGWSVHSPSTLWLFLVGATLILVSVVAFGFTLIPNAKTTKGLDFSQIAETDGFLSVTVGGCEIRVTNGRIETYTTLVDEAVALPCNEYFDDECVRDPRSALGAYVTRAFEGQIDNLVSLIAAECSKTLGVGVSRQKTETKQAASFGPGQCVLLRTPLGRSTSLCLVSTTTQRAGEGLSARISYLFDGMRQMVSRLADARISKVVMPVLGSGHGGLDPRLAFVGLLLAVAEAAHYGQGGQRMKRVTIVVFQRDAGGGEVDDTILRRALALISLRPPRR